MLRHPALRKDLYTGLYRTALRAQVFLNNCLSLPAFHPRESQPVCGEGDAPGC